MVSVKKNIVRLDPKKTFASDKRQKNRALGGGIKFYKLQR